MRWLVFGQFLVLLQFNGVEYEYLLRISLFQNPNKNHSKTVQIANQSEKILNNYIMMTKQHA